MRRSAAIASIATGGGDPDPAHAPQGREGDESNGSIAAAAAAFQDCLICARRAVLAVTGALLRVRMGHAFRAPLRLYCTTVLCYSGHRYPRITLHYYTVSPYIRRISMVELLEGPRKVASLNKYSGFHRYCLLSQC